MKLWPVAAVSSCQRRDHRLSGRSTFGFALREPHHAADSGHYKVFSCFAILIVCGTSYPIETLFIIRSIWAVLVMATAVISRPSLAATASRLLSQTSNPLHEGRNFYQPGGDGVDPAMATSTPGLPRFCRCRRWTKAWLFPAAAFLQPGFSPSLKNALVVRPPTPRQLPRHASFERGWGRPCAITGDTGCIALDGKGSRQRRMPRVVRTEFEVQSTLLSQPGATQRFINGPSWLSPFR